MKLVFHRFFQRDLENVLGYYEVEGGSALADRFYAEFEKVIAAISENPFRFPSLEHGLRRANFSIFPYHILMGEKAGVIQILVLRHHKRHPEFEMKRQ